MKKRNAIHNTERLLFATLGLALASAANVRADYQSTVLGDNPLAYYALNPNNDPAGTSPDLTGNGNNGTAYNIYSVTGPTPYVTNAASFDGADALVDLSGGSNPGLLNFSGPITLEVWAQPANTTEGPADILGKGYDSANNYYEIALRANGGNYFGGTYGPPGTKGASGGVQTTNWAYVVCTYDGTNWNMYVNSILYQSNGDTVGSINFSDPWRIGTGSADGASRYFAGNLSHVALYNHALTQAQVLTHFYMAELNSNPNTSAPIIVAQPQPQATFVGGSVTFSVTAVSALPTTNQWYKNNVVLIGKTNSTLTLTGVSSADAVSYRVVVGNSNGTTNSVSAALTLLASGNSLKWSPNANTGVWDTTNSANWINVTNSQQVVFNPNDQVLFDDTVGVPTSVSVSGTVSPSVFTVNSSTNSYNFSAAVSGGTISGAGSLIKQGSSLLTIVSPGNFTGPVTISGGTVYAGNNCFHSVASFTITNNATLDFGGGTYNTGQPITVSGTGVNGLGALYNSYDDYPGEAFAITLAGDTTFGGTNRWDLVGGSITGPHKVTINWTDVADGNYGEWNSVNIAANVGDLELAKGKLGIKNMGATFGNPAANFIVDSGAELDFWTGEGGYARNFHVMSSGLFQILTAFTTFSGNLTLENGAQFTSIYGSGTAQMNGSITLNGVAHMVIGDNNLVFTNIIAGTGGFVWDAYNHQMVLQASNTYSGPSVIGGGLTLALTGKGSISHSSLIFFGGSNPANTSLDASGRADQTLTLANGQTLGGIGGISGSLVVSSGATLAPGGTNVTLGITAGSSVVGTIAAANNVQLNGTTIIKLNGSGTNDVVQAGAGITYGGTLSLVNVSGSPLSADNSFTIFGAATRGGTFANIVPASPGAGLSWDLTQLGNGVVSVVGAASPPVINKVTFAGGNIVFSGTNGVANTSYVVLSAASLTTPRNNWVPIETNSFDANGAFSVTNPVTPGVPLRFFTIRY